jgi:hypothetical protein
VATAIVLDGPALVYHKAFQAEVRMTVEVWQYARPKGRRPGWAFRVFSRDAVAFESAWVAVRYSAREDASWLAELIDSLIARGVFPGCPGHPAPAPVRVRWEGDLSDDCSARLGDLYAHAEHLSGPRRGGAWYCSVKRRDESLFHTVDCGVQPRSGEAARWLCELIMYATLPG